MQRLFLSIALFGCLGLAACGEEPKPEPTKTTLRDLLGGDGSSTPLAERLPSAEQLVDLLKSTSEIELTDAMMAKYVKLMEELKQGGASASEAWMKARSMDWAEWMGIGAVIASRASHEAVSQKITSVEERVAAATVKLEEAEEESRQKLKSVLKGYRKQLEALRKMPGASDLDRKNQAVLKGWVEKLKALGAL